VSEAPVILVENVSKFYGRNQVLRHCSLSVRHGEVLVICGPSGSGKSTLLKCLNGLEPYQSGRILFEGTEVGAPGTDLPRLRARIGMVFQHFELYPHMSVIDNVALAQIHVLHRSRAQAHERALALLSRVGLREKADAMPANLSGGQQQRVAIARALALDPKAMLFDEPTSALDPEMIGEVLSVMVELAQGGMTMAVVTHEMGFARKVADRIVFMDAGEIVEDAPTEQFFRSPSSVRAREFLSKILQH
jgi:ABC-type polar amino acid transport system ATPase subunit